MSFLNIDQINKAIDEQQIIVRPFKASLTRPASIILRLGSEIIRFRPSIDPIDPYSKESVERNTFEKESFRETIISTHSFVLVSTLESITLPKNFLGFISTLSHIARLGLNVHNGALFVQPGFGSTEPSTLSLEIYNHNPAPIKLYAGMPICQLSFFQIDESSTITYDYYRGTYKGQGPQISHFYKEFEKGL